MLQRSEDRRQEQHEHYQWTQGSGWGMGKVASSRHRGRRYSAAESDSKAEANVPEELRGLWRLNKSRFPRTLEPDNRAELFVEWARQDPTALAEYWSALEDSLTDASYDKAYAMYLAEEAATAGEPAELSVLVDELDEVPF